MMKKKINFVDITVLVIICAVILAGIYNIISKNKLDSKNVDNLDTMKYRVCISGVRQPTIDALHIGDAVYDDTTETYIGKIANIDTEPQKMIFNNIKGEYVEVEKPDYFNVYMDIEVPMLEKDNGYFASGIVEIKTNSYLYTHTKYASPAFQVVELKTEK